MTQLSVNLNKIALLRNSRGRDYPNVVEFAKKFIDLGVAGITVHPRQDERHITIQDTLDLSEMLSAYPDIEFNVEGYPSEDLLSLVEKTQPDQCTLVPDAPDQLTSDHGWDLSEHGEFVSETCARLNRQGIRSAIFLDPDVEHVRLAKKTGTQRIELYTEAYAESYGKPDAVKVFEAYRQAALEAQRLGIEVNAGHDLDLGNLAQFLTIDGILEVSIGHALTIESIQEGMISVVKRYLDICAGK